MPEVKNSYMIRADGSLSGLVGVGYCYEGRLTPCFMAGPHLHSLFRSARPPTTSLLPSCSSKDLSLRAHA